MSKAFQTNKKFGGLNKFNITPDNLDELKEALEEAKLQHKSRFYFQEVEITVLIAQYILRYYGKEGQHKRDILRR